MNTETIISIAVSAFFGIIAIIQTYRINVYNKRFVIRRDIEFYYEIKRVVSVKDIPYDLNIVMKDKSNKNIFWLEGIVGNKGNVVFTKNDLLKPLVISSNIDAEVLEYEIIDKTQTELECEIKPENNLQNLLSLVINNFEPKDAFKFRLLIAASDDNLELKLNGLIKDENIRIKPKTQLITKADYRFAADRDSSALDETGCGLVAIIILGILVGIYFLFLWLQSQFYHWLITELGFTITSTEILSFFLGLLVIIGLITLTIFIIKKIIDKRKPKPNKKPSVTGFGPWFDLEKKG